MEMVETIWMLLEHIGVELALAVLIFSILFSVIAKRN
jgi:hypothetical protein